MNTQIPMPVNGISTPFSIDEMCIRDRFTYQSLFTLSQSDDFVLKLAGPIAIIMLALTGALAALCFVKVYGISFGGAPRSEKAANAREVPKPMAVSYTHLEFGMTSLTNAPCCALTLKAFAKSAFNSPPLIPSKPRRTSPNSKIC